MGIEISAPSTPATVPITTFAGSGRLSQIPVISPQKPAAPAPTLTIIGDDDLEIGKFGKLCTGGTCGGFGGR
jgi:hypothetical protein